jgi:hypothetical protein
MSLCDLCDLSLVAVVCLLAAFVTPGHSKLLHCIGNLRHDRHSSTAAASAVPVMELFGQLACEWGTQ